MKQFTRVRIPDDHIIIPVITGADAAGYSASVRTPGDTKYAALTSLERDDLIREISDGEGLAQGRRAMGDHWAVEDIR